MIVVLDCNILVMCLTSRSPYHPIYKSLVSGKFELAVTEDIVLEYEEIIQRKYSVSTANSFVSLINELPNVKYVTAYYKWSLIDKDPDDNKYCDCAIASSAMYLVTEDKHFSVLRTIPFPKLNTISIDQFLHTLTSK
ncbi:MAG: putative toxin-antitoxin system toxin component, PIN family [Pedobacter sp.]|nr:MAG: putative toxin-antitoxin system toxin component, PIN family [Pedobacter sp.]